MMEKKKIIVLGNLPLATKVIKLVRARPNVELVGVIGADNVREFPSSDGEICAAIHCHAEGIRRLSVEVAMNIEGLHLAISARNNTILKKTFIDHFSAGIVNCHGGYLPEYKGVGGHIFPIVNGEDHTGGTIHWMNEKIDDGAVIDRWHVGILAHDTGVSLFCKINDGIARLVDAHLDAIIEGRAPAIAQSSLSCSNREGRSLFYRQKDIRSLIEQLKQKPDDPHSYTLERALYWPGKDTPHPEYFSGNYVNDKFVHGVHPP